MKAVEFEGVLTPNGQIAIPAEIAGQLPLGESVHVVLRWGMTTDEDRAWRVQGRRRFEAAYAPEDSVYDQLMDETSTSGMSQRNQLLSSSPSSRSGSVAMLRKRQLLTPNDFAPTGQ